MTTIFNGDAIILCSGTMRPQDVAEAMRDAVNILANEDRYPEASRELHVGWLEYLMEEVEAEDVPEQTWDNFEFVTDIVRARIEENVPEGYHYGVNEYDPAEGGFYPIDPEDD